MAQDNSARGTASLETGAAPNRPDFRAAVTAQIVEMLEAGTAPWQKPWEAGALLVPFNPTSGPGYRGGNALQLMATAARKGYDDPRWLTYRQAAANGWQVRQGESGTQIEFWEFADPPTRGEPDRAAQGEEESVKAEPEPRGAPIHRVYTVFNASQVEGIPPHVPQKRETWEVAQTGEDILRNSEARILHDQNDRAFYNRTQDAIHLPPRAAFPTAADYYGTALHELSHWTGHPTRLNRPTLNESRSFGDPSYAREELRAELASVFLAAERGIPHNPEQHAAYVGSWIKALRDDKNEIFRAARDAQRAADLLISLERGRMLAEPQPQLRRETSEHVAAHEPAAGAVAITEKETATENRTPVAAAAGRAPDATAPAKAEAEKILDGEVNGRRPAGDSEVQQSLSGAEAATKDLLGAGARLYEAQTESGYYRGTVLAETQHHLLQKLSERSAAAHPKHLLGTPPPAGANVAIRYTGGQARVIPLKERERTQALGR